MLQESLMSSTVTSLYYDIVQNFVLLFLDGIGKQSYLPLSYVIYKRKGCVQSPAVHVQDHAGQYKETQCSKQWYTVTINCFLERG